MIKPTIVTRIDVSDDPTIQVCPVTTFGWFRVRPASRPGVNSITMAKAHKGAVGSAALSNQLGMAIYSRAAGGDIPEPLTWTFFGDGLSIVVTDSVDIATGSDWIVEVIPNVEVLTS